MLINNVTLSFSPATLAASLAKGVKYAQKEWLAEVKGLIMQARNVDGPDYASAAVLSGSYLFRVVLKGGPKNAGQVHHWDEQKTARGLAKLCAMYPDSYGRIAAGKGTVNDCTTLLQLIVFGYERF